MAGRYRFLEHTADVLFEAYGSTFEAALESAAEAMFSVMSRIDELREERSFHVEERAGSLENLTVFTLSAILSGSEIEDVMPKRFEVESLEHRGGEFLLKGKVHGEKREGKKVKREIKAVTHHLLKIERNGKVSIRVLLDI